MNAIEAKGLAKAYWVRRRTTGLAGAIRGLFARRERADAVREVSLSVAPGELVGVIGANGAGKSTTIKMLTGILHPTAGEARVLGHVPWRERRALAGRIGVVFGQRSQLLWDLPLVESFRLLRWIYGVPRAAYERNLEELSEILSLAPFLHTSVRQLSLGQKMRGDLAAALLHDPELLFLDEPTIGLDVAVRDRILEALATRNAQRGTTVLLTTHDLVTLEKICPRLVLIDQGKILFDGPRAALKAMFGPSRLATVEYAEPVATLSFDPAFAVTRREGHVVELEFNPEALPMSEALARLDRAGRIVDLAISAPSIESVVKRFM